MKIGEALQKSGLLSSDQLSIALSEQEKTHERLGDIILKMGFLTPEQMAPFLAAYFSIPYVNLKEIYKDIKPEVIDLISPELAHRFTAIPIEKKDKTLTLAMFDPLDLVAIDTLRIKTNHKIQCVVCAERDILEAIEYCYHFLPRMKDHVNDFIDTEVKGQAAEDEDLEKSQYGASDRPVVQYVTALIVQAMNSRASDIHLQPKQDKAELRFRIDGVLHDIDPPPKAMLPAITTRIKILSGLDIAERRLPQDGRFKLKIGKAEVDLRTSLFPTIYGESVVIRILDTSSPLLEITDLGLSSADAEQYKKLLGHSYGLVLVTGPTGSGKTTTLYASLNQIKSPEKNIITLEDPVEYRLSFIQQSQVNSHIGFDFARGLRSVLRQDPDIIMVGEIRDRETAEIAIHAALTGHLVFSTLHTNDAAGAVVRLINMGVEPFLITSSLLGIVAQRLIRTICPDCRESYPASKDVLQKLSITSGVNHFYRGKGCPKCLKSGYRGRSGIFELLVLNDEIRKMILEKRSTDEIRTVAQKGGMKTLRQVGIERLKEGVTTPEECLRMTQETEGF